MVCDVCCSLLPLKHAFLQLYLHVLSVLEIHRRAGNVKGVPADPVKLVNPAPWLYESISNFNDFIYQYVLLYPCIACGLWSSFEFSGIDNYLPCLSLSETHHCVPSKMSVSQSKGIEVRRQWPLIFTGTASYSKFIFFNPGLIHSSFSCYVKVLLLPHA